MVVTQEQCLSVFKEATDKVNNGEGDVVSNVVLSLFRTISDLQSDLAKANSKIQLLESSEKEVEPVLDVKDYLKIFQTGC